VSKTSPFTKEHHYREATSHLNAADYAAEQALGGMGGMDVKPAALEFGKSE
jgi:hypothetical protein